MESNNSISFSGSNQGLQVGQLGSHNSIHAEFHHPARPETPPSSFSNVPFPRDPDFVRRDTLIDQIHEKCSVPGARIAVTGLGGVGKSKLAIEYSYQIRSTSPETWVFWIHSSNQARFEQSFRALAEQLKLPGRQDPQANIFQLVENWLRGERKGTWICVLDNVDDEYLSSPPAEGAEGKDSNNPAKAPANAPLKPLLEYIPRSPNGSTIITSRSREVALKMVDFRDLVEVKPMGGPEALDLFQKKLGSPEGNEAISPEETEERSKLVEALEFMPLAIVQAASHIRARKSRYSVAQYLSDFQSDSEAIKLLKKSVGFTYRDWEASNSILITWEMTFNHLRETKPSAADLLSLMCFFDRQSIPEIVIQDQPEAKVKPSSQASDDLESSQSESDDRIDFEDDVATLADYAFISVNEDSSFTMHRLVQLSTRAWLKSHRQLERWKFQFIKNLSREFPTDEYADWPKCQILWPHVICAVSQRPDAGLKESLLEWARLLFLGACYAGARGWFNDMLEMAFLSRKCRVELLGNQSEVTSESTEMLWIAYLKCDQLGRAESLLTQVMPTYRTTFGERSYITLRSTIHLSTTYSFQGRLEEAEELAEKCLAANKTENGENHPETLLAMSSLASTYLRQGRWEEAEQLFIHVIENETKGKLNESLSRTGAWIQSDHLTSLAQIYRRQGRWEKAEKLERLLVESDKARLGEDHPDTLHSMAQLASTYSKQGRHEDAEQLFVHTLNTQKIKLHKDHSDTLMTMANLALLYEDQGRLEEAKQLSVQVMDAYNTKFGENHPDSLIAMGNTAGVYRKQGYLEEAEQLNAKVMTARKRRLGKDHPETLGSMESMALVYLNQGRLEEAKQLNIQAMEARQRKLGKEHPETLLNMISLAMIYRNQEDWEASERLYVRALEGLKNKVGDDNLNTIAAMGDLSVVLKLSGRDDEAIDLLRDCATKYRENFPNHPKTQLALRVLLEWEAADPNVT